MGGVPTPPQMDGKSFLPLLRNGNRNIRSKWPDTFLIESSGRRETPEQIAEHRARAAAAAAAADRKATATVHGSHEENDGKTYEKLDAQIDDDDPYACWRFSDNDDDAVENARQATADDDDEDAEATTSDDFIVMQNDDWRDRRLPRNKKAKGMNIMIMNVPRL